jgi:hypothetical protein
MPLTVFDTKGIPGHRRERIEAAGDRWWRAQHLL